MPPWAALCFLISKIGWLGTVQSHAPRNPAPACSEKRNRGTTYRKCLRGGMLPAFASWNLTQCWATTYSLRGIWCETKPNPPTALLSTLSWWLAADRAQREQHTACLSWQGNTGRLIICYPCSCTACRLSAQIPLRGFNWFPSAPWRTHCSLPLTPSIGSGMETRKLDRWLRGNS